MEKQVAKRTLSAIALAAATMSFQAPASAQSFTKTEAILGGPSALEALLAQQKAAPTPRPMLAPASYSYSRPAMIQAVLRNTSATVVPAIVRDTPPEVSPGVLNGRPDVFGSVALRVGHTPLDARWHKVEHSDVSGSAAKYATSLRDENSVERLEAVNWYVNKRVHFVDDQVRWGRADVWSTANETLNAGKGDCEDYAIAKLAMLRRAGIADKDLYLVVLRDLVRRADHAVAVVRAGGHMYVLDNGTDRLLDSETVHDYRPILTFASNATFTHGYRVHQAPVNIASVDEPSPTPAADTSEDADDQRSRSASLLAFSTGFSK
jgi:predicted transglutaminase-like cysteine proteinase